MGKGTEDSQTNVGSGMSGKEEGKQFNLARAKATELVAGRFYYILASSWFDCWKSYYSEKPDSEKPGPIDNTTILIPTSEVVKSTTEKPIEGFEPQLKTGLSENEDYVILSEAEWKLLFQWYGGGPVIQRTAIIEGKEREMTRVEVYLMSLELVLTKSDGLPDLTTCKWIYLSKRSKIRDLWNLASTIFKTKSSQIRLWDWEDEENDPQTKKCRLFPDLDRTIEEEGLIHQQKIIVEKTKKEGVWPRDDASFKRAIKSSDENNSDDSNGSGGTDSSLSKNGSIFSSFFSCFGTNKKQKSSDLAGKSKGNAAHANETDDKSGSHSVAGDVHEALVLRAKDSEFQPGLCGLRNLGNTCFMNSALQCLSNTTPLRDYFLLGKFKEDINEKNVLGMQGHIAKQFGALLRALWSGESVHLAPKNFKQTLARWAPQFEGYNQHDAHELLAFLLDGLHEDLNRITKKPYVEVKEADGRIDSDVAKEAWEGHLLRNSSVIVDLFHGQLKSTVTCPDCSKVSVTFDPFMYLSVPLQQEANRNLEISYWPLHSFVRGTKYSVRVPRGGTVADVRQALATLVGLSPRNLIITHMSDSRIMKVFQDKEDTAQFAFSGVFMAYEFPYGARPAEKRKSILAHVVHRMRKGRKQAPTNFLASTYGHGWTFQLLGLPFVLEIKKGVTTGNQLYQNVWNKCSRFISWFDEDDDEDEDEEEEESKSSESSANQAENSKTKKAKKKSKTRPAIGFMNPLRNETYPFKLAFVNDIGTSCSICGNCCDGCIIRPTNDPIIISSNLKVPTIGIEWSSQIYDNYYVKDEACGVSLHPTLLAARADSKKSENSLQLKDCLNMYTTTEKLSENDPWYCPKCKEHRCAWKKLDLWKIPEILVVHLKRFQFTQDRRSKLNWQVNFPTRGLSLDDFIINPEEKGNTYDLFAVANHMGGLAGGHYTASAKSDINDQWYAFNDSNVSSQRESDIATPAAYVLFYKKNNQKNDALVEISEETTQVNGTQANGTHANGTKGKPKTKKSNGNHANGNKKQDEKTNEKSNAETKSKESSQPEESNSSKNSTKESS